MLESMTGFGRGTAASDKALVSVEVKTVNGKQGDVSLRVPSELSAREIEIQKICREAFSRGKTTVTVKLETTQNEAGVTLNENRLLAIVRLLERIEITAQLQASILKDQILLFKEEFLQDSHEKPDDEVWPLTENALAEAIDACLDMRQNEGVALASDIRERLDIIEEELEIIEAHSPERVTAAAEALKERLAELLGDQSRIDPDRLAVEVALLADKLDVNEECVRLHSHLTQFRGSLDEEGYVGRRLNFLAQEIHREINTIGSKANHAETARRVIRMKEELERIREQVQNVA